METWKDIINYVGMYQISNLGRVKSLKRVVALRRIYTRTIPKKILSPVLKTTGY